MDGILLVDKPAGWTSFDVVAKVRGILRSQLGQKVKVGHGGTLDPFATGVLVVLIGKATKQADTLLKHDKTYLATLCLGSISSTGDPEGEITQHSSIIPEHAEIEVACRSFLGTIEQTPPAFSAIKINGQRAYDLARKGKEVKLEPRPATIHELTIDSYDYPSLQLTCRVSTGTYIRTLATDIGDKLETGAYLTALRRTMSGDYAIDQCIGVDTLSFETIQLRIRPV